jgi:predicted DCC family thiol-disulfide oxidoreductase YuxK
MEKDSTMALTIFYDSHCPLCLAEIRQLQALDTAGRLRFVSLHADDFGQRYPHIDQARANRILHGQLESGEILLGLDVTYQAWSRVGKHQWLAVLRWPVIKWVADGVYLLFARHRHRIARLLTGKSRCGRCSLDKVEQQ